jgi:immune inhibitor A
MSHRHHGVSRFRVAAAVPALGLVAAGLATAGATSMTAASAGPVSDSSGATGTSDHYINYVEPRIQDDTDRDVRVGQKVAKPDDAVSQALAFDAKHAQGNPVAARQLARIEAKAIKTGQSPQDIQEQEYKTAGETTEARLLTILVEFNDQAGDDFSGTMVPETVFESRECVPGTVQNGPLHNNIPNPADAAHEDNNSMWVEDFSSAFYNQMLYTDEGITERVRPDLTGPDGKPGIDISGYTMKNMYEEMSQGAYTVSGEATPWVEVPHSEAYYGADRCFLNDEGEWEAGPPQTMVGHPSNPRGAGQLAIDAVDALAETNPDFPWARYDIEDQGDVDGDKNLHEPNGIIDHVVLVHAGEDKSGGGGEQGTYAIWAHSSAVTGGYQVPGTDLKISNYIVQPEDSGVGVFAHEYGHDLGLPDLYDTSGAADSDVDFWDLMSSGSHAGPIFQSMPTHMGLWDKWVLGWADPVQLNPGDAQTTVRVGQNSRPPVGSEDGVIVNLPDKVISLADPHSGQNMWWTGNDQDWADNRLTRTLEVPAGTTDAKFWMWNNYVIEEDWDYGFVEVSVDGGNTWTEQKVFDEAGQEVSTPDGYSDPNGRMADYGGKKYGLTGSTGGWQHQYVDMTAYQGQTVQIRLRYATDAAFVERGWFADDFSLTTGGQTVWSDDVESGDNGWTKEAGTFVDGTPVGAGWRMDTGTSINAQFYLVEWRNLDGFDEGLKYAYDTTYSRDSWKVEKIRYNAPGMLVWYRDTTYGNGMSVTNHVANNSTSLPSEGSKGGLLIVDSHFDPLRRTGDAAAADPTTLKNLPSRPQSSNAAFGLQSTYPFTECVEAAGEPYSEYCSDHPAQAPVRTFNDSQGWYPGIEVRRGGALFYRDIDASTVVPSRDNQPYSTRVVNTDGSPRRGMYGRDIGLATPLGSGNPGDDNVDYSTRIKLLEALNGNRVAVVEVTPPAAR